VAAQCSETSAYLKESLPEIVNMIAKIPEETAGATTGGDKVILDIALLRSVFITQLRHFMNTKKLAGKAVRRTKGPDE